jgi:hypothetical protein
MLSLLYHSRNSCLVLYCLHVLSSRHIENGRGYTRDRNINKTITNNKMLKAENQQKCLKCGRGRCCVASASVRRRTAVSEWINWTLHSCPSGGSAKSAPISYLVRNLRNNLQLFCIWDAGNILLCSHGHRNLIYGRIIIMRFTPIYLTLFQAGGTSIICKIGTDFQPEESEIEEIICNFCILDARYNFKKFTVTFN